LFQRFCPAIKTYIHPPSSNLQEKARDYEIA
jgi:hypothetical protein